MVCGLFSDFFPVRGVGVDDQTVTRMNGFSQADSIPIDQGGEWYVETIGDL